MLSGQREQLQVQPAEAKVPLPRMTIGAFEIGTASLNSRWDIPTPAALIGNQRQAIMPRHLLHKGRVRLDGLQSVRHRQGRAA